MTTALEVRVAGQWVSGLMPWGDLSWSTVWPGGSDALTFGVARSHRIFRPDAPVALMWGGECVWGGVLDEPVRGEPLVASGYYRLGEQEPALDGAGNATTDPDTAVGAAIARGLAWSKAGTLDPLAAPIEHTGQLSLSQLLDHDTLTAPGAFEWGVRPTGLLDFQPWPAASMYLLPGVDGLGITRDGYASTLTARYWNGSAYASVTRTDLAAQKRWGRVPRIVPDVLAGGATLTAGQAEEMVDNMLARGRAQIGWTSPIEVVYGDVRNVYQAPVALPRIVAGATLKLHGLEEDVADLAGQTSVDMPIARVEHEGVIPTVATISPRRLVSPMNDVLSGETA